MEYDILLLTKKGDHRVNMDNEIRLTDGFIDLMLNENLPKFRNTHKNEYEIIRKVKRLFDNIQHKFIGQKVTQNEMYIVTAIIDLSKLFQSTVILFERGLVESGNIIIRSCLDLSFKIVELINNKNFIDVMAKELNSEVKSTLNIIKEKKLYNLVPKETVEDLLSHLGSEKTKTKISALQLAEKNDLLDAYILYRLYCNDSHQSIATLNEIQIFEGSDVHLNGNLRLEEFSKEIYMLVSIVMIPLPILIDKFFGDEELKKQYESLIESFHNTFEK